MKSHLSFCSRSRRRTASGKTQGISFWFQWGNRSWTLLDYESILRAARPKPVMKDSTKQAPWIIKILNEWLVLPLVDIFRPFLTNWYTSLSCDFGWWPASLHTWICSYFWMSFWKYATELFWIPGNVLVQLVDPGVRVLDVNNVWDLAYHITFGYCSVNIRNWERQIRKLY